MKLNIRSPQGIHAAELKAINELSEGLRSSWYGYASFLAADREGSMEIDLLIFTHSRILLIEIKHWAGSIKSDGKKWFQTAPTGYTREQSSPVVIKRGHAQRLFALFKKELEGRWNGYYPVDTCVVLSGDAVIEQMPSNERPFVFTLDEFLAIKTEEGFEKSLPHYDHDRLLANNRLLRPNTPQQIKIFEEWMNGGGCIQPRLREAAGFVMTNPVPVFKHDGIYAEYTGVHRAHANNKALMRAWDFNHLGNNARTPKQRANIGLREQRAITYVDDHDHQLCKDYMMQPRHMPTEEEVMEDLVDVYAMPPLFERLDDYLTTVPHTKEVRLELLRALLFPFAGFHKLGLAHRDVALNRLYFNGQSKSITVAGLVAARFPDPQGVSVGDIRSLLAATKIPLPEEVYGETDLDACRIDVYLLGAVSYYIAFNQPLISKDDGIEWCAPDTDPFEGKLDSWLKKAIALEARERYTDAGEMLEQLTRLFINEKPDLSSDLVEVIGKLEAHRSDINLMTDFPLNGAPDQDFARQRMSYRSFHDGQPVTVKIWTGLQPNPSDAGLNRRLLRFMERCQNIRQNLLPVTPLIGFGFSMMGLYTIQGYKDSGLSLTDWLSQQDKPSFENRLHISSSLITALHQLHALGVAHGDLKPDNILIIEREDNPEILLLDTLDLNVQGMPMQSHEYAPTKETTALERDRYAAYLIIDEVFSGFGEAARSIRAEISNALGETCQQIPITLDTLRESLFQAANPPEPDVESLTLEWPNLIQGSDTEEFGTDQGFVYVSARPLHDDIQVFICGLRQKITLDIRNRDNQLNFANVRIKHNISPAELMRDAQSANDPKKIRSQAVQAKLVIHNKQRELAGESKFLNWLRELEAVQAVISQDSEAKEAIINAVETDEGRFDLHRLWQNLVDAERELHPTVTVASPPKQRGRHYTIEIQEDISVFEHFDSNDTVKIISDLPDQRWVYGNLALSQSQGDTLVVEEARSMQYLKTGTKLKLAEQRSEISWQRRQKALNAVLEGDSLIPDLVNWFDPAVDHPPAAVAPLPQPSDASLGRYNLDESKAEAFRHVLRHPLGVVMGPPGTGKTTMLSALLDYLLQQKEVGRILLVSQSHIAVNELASRTREVIRSRIESEGGEEPSMIRLGDRQKVNNELLDVHVDSLQARYRTAFHRDLDSRFLALAPRLKLPNALVAEAGNLYRRFGNEMYQFIEARDEYRNLKAKIEDQVIKEKERESYEHARRSKDRLYNALSRGLLAFMDNPLPVLDADDPLLELLHSLAEKHQVHNPQNIMRLRSVIDISHNWMLRLWADTEGFAAFASRTSTLVMGTLVGIGKSSYNLSQHVYDVAIIDEAGRATASELAMAMQSARRVILVGDHKQLPPLSNQDLVREVSQRLGISEKDVLRTDFERAYVSTNGIMLNTQYRMAPAIGDLISNVFYDNALKTGRKNAPAWMEELPSPWNRTVSWIDSSDTLEDNHDERFGFRKGSDNVKHVGASNRAEVDLICHMLRNLVENDNALEQLQGWFSSDGVPPIGIIAGYRKQVTAIQDRLDTDTWAAGIRDLVKVDTIDAYQGSENRIIILSLVRNNKKNRVGFVDDAPRVNVAISRAKERLLIVGAINMWANLDEHSPLANVYRYINKASNQRNGEYQLLKPDQIVNPLATTPHENVMNSIDNKGTQDA